MLTQKEPHMELRQITIGPVAIAPGAIEQISFPSPSDGAVKGAEVGPDARAVKLYVGRARFDVPLEGEWSVDFPVKKGGLVMLSVQNVSDEPKLFSVAFHLEAEPEEAPLEEVPREEAPLEEAKPASVLPRPELTQTLPPVSNTTPEDLGVTPGQNEVAIVLTRNEAQFLLEHLRTSTPLSDYVKFGIIRRMDPVVYPRESLVPPKQTAAGRPVARSVPSPRRR